jgi:hypothetical protein
MEKQKMTIHRALSELKLIDSKIEKQITEVSPVGINQKGKLINGYIKEEDFSSAAKSKYDSINDLIQRKVSIKSAIVKANGETNVRVGEKTMTIADAITFKAVVVFKKKFIARLKANQTSAISELNKNNDIAENNVQKLLEYTFGKENVKADSKDVDSIRKPYMEANEFHLFDPLDITKKIEAMEKEVSDFEMEVDAVLSEINATTFIEV